MKITMKTQAEVDADATMAALKAEEATLLACLAATDWYVNRFAEKGTAVPSEISAEREAARERISAIRITLKETV